MTNSQNRKKRLGQSDFGRKKAVGDTKISAALVLIKL